ncbi:TMEM165/GDT1 family protein [Marinomonas atlantica]|uniref:TMEM165/GDT1 family protein n=1 Tax=Marinomonas atlantica TaxID=1806668 RepID=UPI000831CE88|nr:TMEM165/GDT1 family protein [Marinomonas atlantica]MCO4785182.1 TMEM165/GDT1 family protein [Marinomonas atlantica]
MEAVLTSISTVALAEMGDKTQLLALFLAARFSSKLQIVLGIIAATIINHLISAWIGVQITHWIPGTWVNWVIGASFIVVGLWILIPDKDDSEESKFLKSGAFFATFILFFIAEVGDKTQIATVLLGANYHSVLWVTVGSTIGMLIANVPVVYAGQWLMQRIDPKKTRIAACVLFVLMGIAAILYPAV